MRRAFSPTELMVQMTGCECIVRICCVRNNKSNPSFNKYNNNYLRDIKYNQRTPAILNKLTWSQPNIRFCKHPMKYISSGPFSSLDKLSSTS